MFQATTTDDDRAQPVADVTDIFSFMTGIEYEFVGGGNAVNGY